MNLDFIMVRVTGIIPEPKVNNLQRISQSQDQCRDDVNEITAVTTAQPNAKKLYYNVV